MRPNAAGERTVADPLTYSSYLRLPELLRLPRPRSDSPDELLFIVAHQAIELWLKVIIADVRQAVRRLDEDRWIDAALAMHRATCCSDLVLAQTRGLRRLPVAAFHAFRRNLGTASGAQSVQFRELELLAGLRDPQHLAQLRETADPEQRRHFDRLLGERSLAEAHQRSLARHDPGPRHLLDEQLLDFDEVWLSWRAEHLMLVERMLGTSLRGTGGSQPAALLGNSLRYRFFPHLWQARSALAGAHANQTGAG